MIVLEGNGLTLEAVRDVARGEEVSISPEADARLEASRVLVYELVESNVPVYGFNTGVGWNKDKHIAKDFFEQYNKNLIYSHTIGVLPEASEEEVRAIMCVRLNALLCGCTGIQPDVARMYMRLLNKKIHPIVPERGSIGEGDITILSHIGLAMIGEGFVNYEGKRVPTSEAFKKAGLDPVVLGPKDGLAIVSSNAVSAGQGSLVLSDITDLIDIADKIYALSLEGLNGNTSPLDPKVLSARKFEGQQESAKRVCGYLEGSYIYDPDPDKPVQDPLCFRGGAYVHGALRDAVGYVANLLCMHINSTDDNPCSILDEKRMISCSNFETTNIACGFEMLGLALSHVSKMSCYRMIKLGTPAFSRLPRFLTPSDDAHALGTIQKTFTLLDAEIRHLSNPCTVDFMSVAGEIEDHANNTPFVVQKTRKIVGNLKYILGMELLHAAQAISLRLKQTPALALGKGTAPIYEAYRKKIAFLDKDRPLSPDVETSYQFVKGLKS